LRQTVIRVGQQNIALYSFKKTKQAEREGQSALPNPIRFGVVLTSTTLGATLPPLI
jgi:hypothetical protein